MAGFRRAARERALHILYEAEIKDTGPVELLAELPAEPDPFSVDLVRGVASRASEIDALLSAQAEGWSLERMPLVDRNVLRLATFELLYHPDVPTGVVVAEAVELASQFSTEASGRYVNGVLAALAERLRGVDDSNPAKPSGQPVTIAGQATASSASALGHQTGDPTAPI